MANLVTVRIYPDVSSAMCARTRLQAAGIHVFAPELGFGQLYYGYDNALGGFRILVPPDDLETASELLGQEELPPEDAVAACPECGSTKTMRRALWFLMFPLLYFTGFPMPLQTRKRVCLDCKHKWLPPE